MLFSECRFAMTARFQLQRLDFDFKSNTYVLFDQSKPSRIEAVKQKSAGADGETSYQVKLILGDDG